MVYVTGDTHGQIKYFAEDSVIDKNLTTEDVIIVCGDFGFLFNKSYKEYLTLKHLSQKPYTILFIDGNHENFDLIDMYPVEIYCGGKAHVIQKVDGIPKVVHLMRGEIYTIHGKRILCMGGGYSIDRYCRIPQVTWWSQELPTDAEIRNAIQNIEKNNYKVDYIITHTAPEKIVHFLGTCHPKETKLNNFLEWINEKVEFEYWFFGHFHEDKVLSDKYIAMYECVRNIETAEILL